MHDPTEERLHQELERQVGRTLCGRYTLEALIGVGGMAAVYRGNHRNGYKVAVKVLHTELSASVDLRRRFLREGYVANKVQHHGAVAVTDDDTAEDGSVFLVMELLEGETLEDRIASRGGVLPASDVVPLACQLLEVLEAAHEKGIVHRDIKPENLFVERRNGKLRVLDFGIARLAGARQRTRSGRAMGTPVYMAPEQARGQLDQIDERTDLWAVGAVLYRALTGRFVHEAETSEMTMVLAATQPASPLAEAFPAAPKALAELVDRALATCKDDRFGSAAEMRDALGKLDTARLSTVRPATVTIERPLDGLDEQRESSVGVSTIPLTVTEDPAREGLAKKRPKLGAPRHVPGGAQARVLRWLEGARPLAAVALLAIVLLWRGHRPEASPATEAPRPAFGSSPPTSALEPSPASPGSPVSPLPTLPQPVPSSVSPALTALPTSATPASGGARAAPRAKPARPSLAAPASSCAPPYYFDAAGNKRRKLDCYR